MSDFAMKSCLNQEFASEMLKAMLDAGDSTSYKARYRVTALPRRRPQLWAVNPGTNDEAGQPDCGSWFRRSIVSVPLVCFAVEDKVALKSLSERDKAIVWRAVIFTVAEPFFEASAPELETEQQAKRHRKATTDGRYML